MATKEGKNEHDGEGGLLVGSDAVYGAYTAAVDYAN